MSNSDRNEGEKPISKVSKLSKSLAFPKSFNLFLLWKPLILLELIGAARAVSKNELDFAVVQSQKVLFHLEVSNDKKGIADFIKHLKKHTDATFESSLFCMEFTGIYNNILLNYLSEQNTSIWVENARQIKDSMGTSRGKTDKLDSIQIAQYAYKNRETPRLWSPKRDVLQELDGTGRPAISCHQITFGKRC